MYGRAPIGTQNPHSLAVRVVTGPIQAARGRSFTMKEKFRALWALAKVTKSAPGQEVAFGREIRYRRSFRNRAPCSSIILRTAGLVLSAPA